MVFLFLENQFCSAENRKKSSFKSLAILNVRELLPIVQARGINFAHHAADISFYNRPAWIASFLLRALIKISPPFRLLITAHNNAEEVKSYCSDVLNEAHHLKITVPRLEVVAKRLLGNKRTVPNTSEFYS